MHSNDVLENKTFSLVTMQQILAMRRGTVYRFLSSSLQLLLLGNAGGIGFVVGLFPTGPEPTTVHWMRLIAIFAFLIGCLMSAGTIASAASLALKEAHAAEIVLIDITKGTKTLEEAAVFVDKSTYSMAAVAMLFGLASLFFLLIGAIISSVMLFLYY